MSHMSLCSSSCSREAEQLPSATAPVGNGTIPYVNLYPTADVFVGFFGFFSLVGCFFFSGGVQKKEREMMKARNQGTGREGGPHILP